MARSNPNPPERTVPPGTGSHADEEPSLSWRVRPIGIVRAPFSAPALAPPHFANIGKATVQVFSEFESGLKGIEGFSHLWLLVLLNGSNGGDPLPCPQGATPEFGIFATREPRRPNPIGLTLVELVKRDGPALMVVGSDLCDHTPVLDIKPYLPAHDRAEAGKLGCRREDKARSTTPAKRRKIIVTIAVPLAQGAFSSHFGGADHFALFRADETAGAILSTRVEAPPPHEQGALPAWLNSQGVGAVLAGGMGPRAVQMLEEIGVKTILGIQSGEPEALVRMYLQGKLKSSQRACQDHALHHRHEDRP
jgi:tRNA-Thr(GGU) m(6)t(6)A37 methyltransferase TsaA